MNFNLILERLRDIVSVPVSNPELIPSIIPLAVGFVLIELYFGRYKDEEMGWNSAVGNTTLLISTSLMLYHSMYMAGSFTNNKIIVASGILSVGIILLVMDFFHIVPSKVAFKVSSPFVIYFLAYGAIAIYYAGLPLDQESLAAFAVLFGFVFGAVKSFQFLIE